MRRLATRPGSRSPPGVAADLELSPLAARRPSLQILVSQSLWSRVGVLEGTEPGCGGDCSASLTPRPHRPPFGQRKSDRKARGLGSQGQGPAFVKETPEPDSS